MRLLILIITLLSFSCTLLAQNGKVKMYTVQLSRLYKTDINTVKLPVDALARTSRDGSWIINSSYIFDDLKEAVKNRNEWRRRGFAGAFVSNVFMNEIQVPKIIGAEPTIITSKSNHEVIKSRIIPKSYNTSNGTSVTTVTSYKMPNSQVLAYEDVIADYTSRKD